METENEKKTEGQEVVSSEEKKADEKISYKEKVEKIKKFFSCKCKNCCATWKENRKTFVVLFIVAILVAGSFLYKGYWKKNNIGTVAAKAVVQKFIDENSQPGTKAEIKDPVKESGLYKMDIAIGKQIVPVYLSTDGKKLFPQAIDLGAAEEKKNATDDKQAAAEEGKTEAENKIAVPEVDLFVMSYCPYGLQMERGVLPAVEALKNKIKFNLKFVDYTLHGQKEVDENLNQYCIQKTQGAKLGAYLKCFWKSSKGTADACMKTAGINSYQIKTCVADAQKQFNPTEKDFSLNAEDNAKFGVSGSPTFVVNGTTIAINNRDSASVLKAICSGFANKPKECEAKLSSDAPGAGFDDQIAAAKASGGAASSDASCEQ